VTLGKPIYCPWCNRPVTPRQTGGRDQRFCRPSCRRAFHAAARTWALAELAAGRLTVAQIMNGLPATCALATEGGMQQLVPEAVKALDALLSDLLAALPADVWSGLPNDILDQIDAYLDCAEQGVLQT
jgi:hypothetical protein